MNKVFDIGKFDLDVTLRDAAPNDPRIQPKLSSLRPDGTYSQPIQPA